MGTTSANAEVVSRMYEAYAADDLVTVRDCFTEDAVWHMPGRSRIAGDHLGRDAIFKNFLDKLMPLSGGTLRTALIDVLVGQSRVVALQHATGERHGRKLDALGLLLMTIQDGRIAEVRGFYWDQDAMDAFWS